MVEGVQIPKSLSRIEQTNSAIQSEKAAESTASSVCDQRLDAEWVRIHDLAAVPDNAASAPDESAQPVRKVDALGIVARNYETCQQWRNELIGWQSWWASQNTQ